MTITEVLQRRYQTAKSGGLVLTLNDLDIMIRCEFRKEKIRNIFGIEGTNDKSSMCKRASLLRSKQDL